MTTATTRPRPEVTRLEEAEPASRPSRWAIAPWVWGCIAATVASTPFLPGLSSTRIFFVRDLSMFFWGRYLWLRRSILSGEWPLWDPYVGAGQSAVADALHQMFLLPVLAIRLVGSEVLGFNLWVALPFPLAALGAWLFFGRRFSTHAAVLGAIAFSLSGPVVSTGNFPNMSWSVAMMPWVLWAADRVAAGPGSRRLAVLALAVAFQALAGEPVTFSATLAIALGLGLLVPVSGRDGMIGPRLPAGARVLGGLTLGAALAAIQLVPMVAAASLAERSKAVLQGLWSVHPVALAEMIALHIFGDYFAVSSLADIPWMPLVNSGREPFFFSIYLGVPVLAVALFGMVAAGWSRWTTFWAAAGAVGLVFAFGIYTPIYPFLRDHAPILGSFRSPAKYLVVVALSAAAGLVAGWDAIERATPGATFTRARWDAVGVALLTGLAALAVVAACAYVPEPTGERLSSMAQRLGASDGRKPAALMLQALPQQGLILFGVSLAASALLCLATSRRRQAPLARLALAIFIVGDLLARASGINPTLDPRHLAEPAWLSRTKSDPDSRFYVGGKKDGTLDFWDLDSSRAFLRAPGLEGSASRAALNAQSAFYPSAWHGREMLSYDLAVLWPLEFQQATKQFFEADRAERDRFLDRTGVRYRILPARVAAGRAPLVKVPYFMESSLYDWGPEVAPRAAMVMASSVVPDPKQQVDSLFRAGWDSRATVTIERETVPAGEKTAAVAPFARIVTDRANRVVVEAGAGDAGGYLVLLDSFSDDWQVTVDGTSAPMVRANGLFRAVRLVAGRHVVAFTYRPRAFLLGAALSTVALIVTLGLCVVGTKTDGATPTQSPTS